jgi:hypothetical protein
MKELVKVVFNGDLKVNSVDARELWSALGYTEEGYRFRRWVEQRLDDTMAESNIDFKPALKRAGENKGQLSNRIDYIITIDLAKEFCMLERTSIGKDIRKYFIQCESELLSQPKIVQRLKGDDSAELNRLMLDIGVSKRTELEGKTGHKGYCINMAKTVNLLCFGVHEPNVRQHMTQSFQVRLNAILADVARLALKGITNPKLVYETLSPKYTLQLNGGTKK